MDKKNSKLSSFFCDPKTALKNVGLLLLMIFVVVYSGFQILPSFSQRIETSTALAVSVFDTNKTTGYIFRDETPISAGANIGVPVTLVEDGERISKGQHYANVYSSDNYASLQQQINAIDDKIEILEKSVVETNAYVTDITKTDKEIEASLDKIYSGIAKGDISEIPGVEDSLLVSLNKRELIVSMTDGYKKEIDALKAERADLESRISAVSQRLTSSVAGYYYGDTDGYENIFTLDKLENLTFESFKELTERSPESAVLEGSIGKVVKSYVWYLACEVEREVAASYKEGHYYTLNFPTFSEDEMKMELQKIITSTSEHTSILVFRGNTAPEGFTYQRSQPVNIISDKYTGYAIPKDALRIVDGLRGVYIMNGDIVRFRRVNIIFENEDYYLAEIPVAQADDEADDDETEFHGKTYPYLSLYDSVIVKGKDLFDGKTV